MKAYNLYKYYLLIYIEVITNTVKFPIVPTKQF